MKKNNTIKIILSILFIVALFKMPYNYYEIMRFTAMIGFTVLGYKELNKENDFYMVVWFASALLINPFFKLALGRFVWNIIDIVWIILLISSIFLNKSK